MNNRISIEDITEIAYALAVKYFQYDEPLSDFDLIKHQVDIGRLDGAISAPFQTHKGEYLLNDFYLRAGALFYYLSKAHALINGNKRLAMTSLMVFMAKNKKWIAMSNKNLYELSRIIATSDIKEKDTIMKIVASFIKYSTESWDENNPI